MTEVYLLACSFQTFVAVLTALLAYNVWNNWDESKRVAAELWKPVHNTVVFFGTILSRPEKVLAYIFILITIQMFPSILDSISSGILKSSKLNA